MIDPNAITAGINLAAEILAGGPCERLVVCVCTHCLGDLDPHEQTHPHRAPAWAECQRCGDPERERTGGLVFVAVARELWEGPSGK